MTDKINNEIDHTIKYAKNGDIINMGTPMENLFDKLTKTYVSSTVAFYFTLQFSFMLDYASDDFNEILYQPNAFVHNKRFATRELNNDFATLLVSFCKPGSNHIFLNLATTTKSLLIFVNGPGPRELMREKQELTGIQEELTIKKKEPRDNQSIYFDMIKVHQMIKINDIMNYYSWHREIPDCTISEIFIHMIKLFLYTRPILMRYSFITESDIPQYHKVIKNKKTRAKLVSRVCIPIYTEKLKNIDHNLRTWNLPRDKQYLDVVENLPYGRQRRDFIPLNVFKLYEYWITTTGHEKSYEITDNPDNKYRYIRHMYMQGYQDFIETVTNILDQDPELVQKLYKGFP